MTIFLIIILTIIYVFDAETLNIGTKAKLGEAAHFVTIEYQNEVLSSGAIIHESYIITIDQRVAFVEKISEVSVIAGDIGNEQYFKIHYIFGHPESKYVYWYKGWNNPSYNHDFAIIRISSKFVWSLTIAPMRLIPVNGEWLFHKRCNVAGLSQLKANNKSNVLLRTKVSVIKSTVCQLSMNVNLRDYEECIDYLHERSNIDYWDAGTALVCEDFLVGILVREKIGSFSIFRSLQPYVEWIYNIVEEDEKNFFNDHAQHYVTIWNLDYFTCGGFIIDETHILTAGHCVTNIMPCNLIVAAGITKIINSEAVNEWLTVLHIVIHPEYRPIFSSEMHNGLPLYIENDIAILTLQHPLDFRSQHIAPVPLALQEIEHPKICQLSRWLLPNEEYPFLPLRYETVSTRTLSAEDCHRRMIFRASKTFCSDYLYSVITLLRGNSGSPLFYNEKVVGMVIAAPLITQDFDVILPITFLDLHFYLDFIVHYAPQTDIVF